LADVHRIKRGLDLPIAGRPDPVVGRGRPVTKVAILGADYIGMRPTLHVEVGQQVKRGQLLFEDKKMPGVRYTSPGTGTVVGIHRGERRVFQSIVIELNDRERAGSADESDLMKFESYSGQSPAGLDRRQVQALLVESGLWTAIRARPFGRVANPEVMPRAVFVTAIDTNPLAASVDAALAGREADFQLGVEIVARLTDGPTFVCKGAGSSVPVPRSAGIREEVFDGPHPAGSVGLHIHVLAPVCREKVAWHLNYQDAAAVGHLFRTGRIDVTRVVSLAGPAVSEPRLVATRLGACLDELTAGELQAGDVRVISGSVLSGRTARGEALGYLGRYHLQVSALKEGRGRELFGWAKPGLSAYSSIRVFLSGFLPRRRFDLTTATNGSDRAIVPIGMYERVMPMDIQPTYLLRSLAARDVERAEQLGALELEEEDLALCSFVCPGKGDYGAILRETLDILEKEG